MYSQDYLSLFQKRVLTYRYYTLYIDSHEGVASVTTKKSSWQNEHLKFRRRIKCPKYHYKERVWRTIMIKDGIN